MKVCITPGCDKPARSKDLCMYHYNKMRELGRYGSKDNCSVKGCGFKSFARGLCSKHYQFEYRNKRLKSRFCEFELGCFFPPLPNGDYCAEHKPVEICYIEGCNRKVKARGRCATHYQALRREEKRRQDDY